LAAACSSPSSAAYAKFASPNTEAPPTVAPVMATPFNKFSTFFFDIMYNLSRLYKKLNLTSMYELLYHVDFILKELFVTVLAK